MPSPIGDRLGGHGQGDDRQVETCLADVARHLEAVHLALQQGVDDEHVRLKLAHLVDDLRPSVMTSSSFTFDCASSRLRM